MNRFTPYSTLVPNTGQPIGIEFDGTTKGLLKLTCIEQYLNDPHTELTLSGDCIYGIEDDGLVWILLGTVKDPSTINLPIFPGWRIPALRSDGELIIVTSTDIKKIIGQDIWLKDGTQVTEYGAVA